MTQSNRSLVDDALADLLTTDVFYGPGFANHGPMVVEALEHRGMQAAIPHFLKAYRPQLKSKVSTARTPSDWEQFLRSSLPALASHGAAIAGHGLLRVAHSVRALERSDTETRRADLGEAVRYWSVEDGIEVDRRMNGDRSFEDVVREIPRLAPQTKPMLSESLAAVSANGGVAAVLETLRVPDDPLRFLDSLALESAECYLSHDESLSFGFIHGVTVPVMARVLVPYLTSSDLAGLVSSVAGFVVYTIAAFDQFDSSDRSESDRSSGSKAVEVEALASQAAATANDHTIKFVDACLSLAERTGSARPLAAALVRIAETS